MFELDRRALLLGLPVASAPLAEGTRQAPGLRAVSLQTAMRLQPLGIDDPRPMLSWRLEGPAGAVQSAYQIMVASTPEKLRAGVADLWDSGRVKSSESVGVRYGGAPLKARQRCFWRVKTWDAAGRASEWSPPATWEMGLIDQTEWIGDWLAVEAADERDDRAAGVRWVEAQTPKPHETCRFRLSFRSGMGEGRLVILTEGKLSKLVLDGRVVELPWRNPNGYGDPPALAFPLRLEAGAHELIVEVTATGPDGGPGRAVLGAQVRMLDAEGAARRVVDGWESEAADAWKPAVVRTTQPHFPWPPTPARLLRRAFTLSKPPTQARLYVSALGGYRIWLNGRRVGDDELQSEPAQYRRHVPYRAYDVTDLLRDGENVVGLMVGDGTFASYQAPDGRYAYGPAPRRVRLFIESRDAEDRVERIATDAAWRHAISPVLMSEIYAGEDHDLRLWPHGWAEPGFDDSGWSKVWTAPPPEGGPCALLSEPIRETRILKAVSIRAVGPDRHIVDFGQNFAGRVRLRVKGAKGALVIVRHAEILDGQGGLDRRNLRVARAEDRYILNGDDAPETLQPIFTYQGFRYAEIQGVATLGQNMIDGVVLSSDLPEIGVFRTAEPVVQNLWLNSLWSQRSNFMGIPTDCPQRDERLGWTGDAQVFWETAAFNMDVGGFTRGFTRTLRDDQAPNGAYPMWSPSPRGLGWGTTSPTPGWADGGVMLPYVAYLHSGDRSIVDENWEAMSAYASGVLAENPDGLWRRGRGADFGDWLALDGKSPGDATTPKDLIATAMLARSVDQLAQMAAWTGRSAEAKTWRAQGDRIKATFASAFARADGTVGNGSHTGYILALRLGPLPQGLRKAAGEKLAADIRRRGTLLSTGFLGTPLALDTLVDHGHTSLAFDLLLRTEYPSWGYMVRRGATTTWERWNGDTGDVSMNSFNHYALGAVCGFLYRRVTGIEPITPGFGAFRVAPLIDRRLQSAGATVDSARGRIETNWQVSGDRAVLKVRVPANSRAEVVLPTLARSLGAGEHTLSVSLTP
ncbi:glycoside hydrolase family 78 protein [Caulobacter sp. BP25]|uniref:glycoside hydrolase family 78 protein n=1 Tax=Caulobacter sp. BP25 TaxID=2048900 RepID=UPI000C12D4BF|nr:glycoside hydrolase family 78 protein [Caulobacter sp. BP25]PHY18454.1 alpha-L-rhamnosidase [Caulobacter sp. BP25]